MAKRFSRKDYEEMLDKNTNEVKMYWESEAGQKRIEKNKKNPFPMTPTLLEMIAVLKNFESKTGQTIPAFFKNVRDKQENECELILKSIDAYAEKNGLIKPMDKDEFAGFYLWLFNQDEFIDNNPDRSHYIDFHDYMKQEIDKIETANSHLIELSESWKDLIIIELYDHLSIVESKIESKISQWKQGEMKIVCAAFCQLLFDKKYFVTGSTNRATVNKFALNKYGMDISTQLESKFKEDREKHKLLLKKYFK